MSISLTLPQETILVVSDNGWVVAEFSVILTTAGFSVLSASTPDEAIQISLTFAGEIHLLLTAVMMPGMSGTDLASKLIEQRIKLRFMMMTGYADGSVLLLNYGWHMLKKACLTTGLLERVNIILRAPDRSQGTSHFDTTA